MCQNREQVLKSLNSVRRFLPCCLCSSLSSFPSSRKHGQGQETGRGRLGKLFRSSQHQRWQWQQVWVERHQSKEADRDTLRTVVPSIFQESQKTSANHHKNANLLRKIQEQCAEIVGEEGEEAFNKEFIRNLNVVLAIKKKEPSADRVIQFVSSFIIHTRKKGESERNRKSLDRLSLCHDMTLSHKSQNSFMIEVDRYGD